MRRRLSAAIAVAAAMLASGPALAEASMGAFEATRAASLAVWAELPLTARNVALTAGPATGYGQYQPHEGRAVAIGEPIHVYVEVLGYGWRDNGDGTVSEVLEADLNLIDASGATLASQAKFLSTEIRSRHRLLETYLTLQATLTAFEPGAYTLRYVLRDVAGGKETSFDVPITLLAQ